MAKYKYSFKAYSKEGNLVVADTIYARNYFIALCKFTYRHLHYKYSFINYSRYFLFNE